MHKILCLNKISPVGTARFGAGYEFSTEMQDPEGILVRSAAMHDMELPKSLLAIARAGAGVNNIPIQKCAEAGIVVFNTPGANANAVKELVLAALLMTSRRIIPAIEWAKTLKGSGKEVSKRVEKGKSAFVGPELLGKTLGVIGLGAIGAEVANAAAALGMEDTHFVTPSGLDGEDAQGLGHLSTAYDMALLARAALEDQAFRQLCSSPSLAVEFAEPVKRVTYTNHNKLLAQYQGCVGVKTGFTKEAGRCLVSAAERDGALLIAVTLNAPNDWQDHTALLDYGFSQVEPYPLAGGDGRLTVPVVGSPVEVVSLRGSNGGEVTLPLGQGAQVERVVRVPKFLYAPVEAGEQVGEICWYLEGQLLGSAPLTAAGAAPLQEKAPSLWERLFG